jgi:predicted PurR-regulated permease PerM
MIFSQKALFWFLLLFSFIYIISILSPILPPFIAAFIISYFFSPLASKLEKLGLSRGIASALIVLSLVLIISLIFVTIIPMAVHQIANFITEFPGYRDKIILSVKSLLHNKLAFIDKEMLDKLSKIIEESTSNFFSYLVGFVSSLIKSSVAFVNVLGLLFISPVIAFYSLKDWPKMVTKFDSLIPVSSRSIVRKQFSDINDVLYNYLCGQTYVCIFLSCFYCLGLTLIGLKYALFLGIFTGVLALIPYVGVSIGIVVGLIISFMQFGTVSHMLYTISVFAIGQFIEGNFITPKIVGGKVGLHPVVMILSMFSGGLLIGFVGVLFAIPIAAVIGVFVRFLVSIYKTSNFYR